MTDLVIVESISSCAVLEPKPGMSNLRPGDQIVAGEEIGGGGFGTVYRCSEVDGLATRGVVVKRHHVAAGIDPLDGAGVISALHLAIEHELAGSVDVVRSHLPGVPFWVGRCGWGLEDAVVTLAADLSAAAYQPFESVVEDAAELTAWLRLPLVSLLATADDFAVAAELLEQIGFVHGDINVENVFVDRAGSRATLIDFDAGWIRGCANPTPLAWGKPDDFLAPEIRDGAAVDPAAQGPLAERWSVGTLLHYLLFGVGPLFFLTGLSTDQIRSYLASYTWPDIDGTSPLFNRPNRGFYSRYLQQLAELPPALLDLFRRLVGGAVDDPAMRPCARDWHDGLKAAIGPPVFEDVAVSAVVTVVGRPIRVSWSATNATSVSVDGQSPLPAVGATDVLLERSRPVELVATNPFGSTLRRTDSFTVLTAPEIRSLRVPEPKLTVPSISLNVPLPSNSLLARIKEVTPFPLISRLRPPALGKRPHPHP